MPRTGFRSAEEAEEAFYQAFQAADLEAMMAVWADEEAIVCIHPMSQRLQGPQAVREGWQRIFESGATLRFDLTDVQYTQGSGLSVHCLQENITYGPRFEQQSVVLSTNVYAEFASGWRMVAHHASPGDATEAEPEPDSHPQVLH